jgi:quinol monooxygenase YgiN
MLVRVITAYVNEKDVDAFKDAMRENQEHSIQEPGILRFDVLQSADDPTEFLLYEVYTSEQAAEDHKKTPHYNKWKETAAPMMVGDRVRKSYSVVAPTSEEAW